MFFENIKYFYAIGLYNKDDLNTLKMGSMLTEDQYNELVGESSDTASNS